MPLCLALSIKRWIEGKCLSRPGIGDSPLLSEEIVAMKEASRLPSTAVDRLNGLNLGDKMFFTSRNTVID